MPAEFCNGRRPAFTPRLSPSIARPGRRRGPTALDPQRTERVRPKPLRTQEAEKYHPSRHGYLIPNSRRLPRPVVVSYSSLALLPHTTPRQCYHLSVNPLTNPLSGPHPLPETHLLIPAPTTIPPRDRQSLGPSCKPERLIYAHTHSFPTEVHSGLTTNLYPQPLTLLLFLYS